MGGMHTQGPLSILFRAVRDRLRVKVWTRSHTRVRSILTGFVHAYDRHLNLALADVDEVLLLPPAPSLPTATGDANEKKTATETTTSAPAAPLPTQCDRQLRLIRRAAEAAVPSPQGRLHPVGTTGCAAGVCDPRPLAAERTAVVAQKRPARTGRIRRRAAAPTLAPRSRHVNQLFVRGDNVVSVALMPV
ncbi:hypothetical protein HPB52_002635 [Rhipicephalus sanguineus]|uniref:Sm domain-containing protein n=1 Tax=Rhipicephalus sanguineus TaxID=34632 RepID=A0A9D4Q559_RHISA|nr:hypothetical protein HPB52_002635 [Rhipicephalus sanguineus]